VIEVTLKPTGSLMSPLASAPESLQGQTPRRVPLTGLCRGQAGFVTLISCWSLRWLTVVLFSLLRVLFRGRPRDLLLSLGSSADRDTRDYS